MQILCSNITPLRLLGVDSGMNEVTQNLSSFIAGTPDRLSVTDNGAGGVTLDVSASLGIAWSQVTDKPPMDYSGGVLTISGSVYVPDGISTVEGVNSSGWDACYNDFYAIQSDITATIARVNATLERYYLPADGSPTTNVPMVAGKTYFISFKGFSWDTGSGSNYELVMPDFSTFRSGAAKVRYADGGMELLEFSTGVSFACYDGLTYIGECIVTAGTTGNMVITYQGGHTRQYLLIREIQH